MACSLLCLLLACSAACEYVDGRAATLARSCWAFARAAASSSAARRTCLERFRDSAIRAHAEGVPGAAPLQLVPAEGGVSEQVLVNVLATLDGVDGADEFDAGTLEIVRQGVIEAVDIVDADLDIRCSAALQGVSPAFRGVSPLENKLRRVGDNDCLTREDRSGVAHRSGATDGGAGSVEGSRGGSLESQMTAGLQEVTAGLPPGVPTLLLEPARRRLRSSKAVSGGVNNGLNSTGGCSFSATTGKLPSAKCANVLDVRGVAAKDDARVEHSSFSSKADEKSLIAATGGTLPMPMPISAGFVSPLERAMQNGVEDRDEKALEAEPSDSAPTRLRGGGALPKSWRSMEGTDSAIDIRVI